MIALVVAIALLTTQLGHPLVEFVLLPFLATLLAAHVDRESQSISLWMLRAARPLLPRRHRDDLHDEWVDHVLSAGERGVAPLWRALSITLIAVPLLAAGLRVGARRRRART